MNASASPSPHYRPGVQQRGEDTRRRILETAIEIFARDGYEGASTRVLAQQAGINLPAIQYYFGSKEGLYRAAIEHIVSEMRACMGTAAANAREALARGDVAPNELISLLHDMLASLITLMVGGQHAESRKRFIGRGELEGSEALDMLHKAMMGETVGPCAALIARLLGRDEVDEAVMLRTVLVLGQVTIFCNKGARCALEWNDIGEERVSAVKALVREQTDAIIRVAMEKGA